MRFGFHFGAAFQIRDDLLNLVGDEQIYGKEILGDLYEGKRTLPLVHLLAVAKGPGPGIGSGLSAPQSIGAFGQSWCSECAR